MGDFDLKRKWFFLNSLWPNVVLVAKMDGLPCDNDNKVHYVPHVSQVAARV